MIDYIITHAMPHPYNFFLKTMSFLLQKLESKKEIDHVIKRTEDKVLVLRFGKEDDPECLKMDDIVSRGELYLIN